MTDILTAFKIAPIDNRPIAEWAEENITLPPSYAMPGRFRVGPSRHILGPLEAIQDHDIRKVVVRKATQTFGSGIADLCVPWFVLNRPGPIMFASKAEDMIEDHIRSRIIPVMRRCKAMQQFLPADPRKMTSTRIDLTNDVTIFAAGATETNLQSKSILLLVCDEVWQWDPGRLAWAQSRVSAFERAGLSKILIISQAGTKGDDEDQEYCAGTQEQWSVQCDGCRLYFIPRWKMYQADGSEAGMLWTPNETTRPGGVWDFAALAPTIRVVCPHCGHAHRDSAALKARWNATGKYVQMNPRPSPHVRSFQWPAYPLDRWSGLVEQWLRGMESLHAGDSTNLVTFIQQKLAEPHDPDRGVSSDDDKVEVVKEPDVKWDREVVRLMAVDVQEDHFWVEIRAWAANGDSRQIYFGKVTEEDDLHALAALHSIPRTNIGVDCRNTGARRVTRKRPIYDMIARNGWFGLSGEGRERPFVVKVRRGNLEFRETRNWSGPKYGDPGLGRTCKPGVTARYYAWWETPFREMLRRIRDGKGAKWECLPNEEYRKQFWAERLRRSTDKAGRIVDEWVQRRKDNHGWDTGLMQCVMARMHPKVTVLQSGDTGADREETETKETETNEQNENSGTGD